MRLTSRVIPRLGWEDLDLIVGGSILLGLVLLILSTVGHPSKYTGRVLEHSHEPPAIRAIAVLLDRRAEATSIVSPEEAAEVFAQGFGEDRPDADARQTVRSSGASFPLGTDAKGRDIWLGLRLGSRTVLLPGALASALAIVLGLIVGVGEEMSRSGFVRGSCRSIRTILGSLPKFLVLLVVLGANVSTEGGMLLFAIAVGTLGSARVAEIIRNQVLVLRRTEVMEACREIGLGARRIMIDHVLNGASRGLLLSQFVFGMSEAILLEAMMAAIGWKLAGFNQATWANMVAEEFGKVRELVLWPSLPPALAIVILIAGLALLGNGLGRRLHLSRLEG